MWTKKSTSPSPEFPSRVALIQFLIEQLVQKNKNSSWVHIELLKKSNFLGRLFSGQSPFVEVAFSNNQFELNLGFQQKKDQKVPSNWQKTKTGFQVPRSDLNLLCNWIGSFLENPPDGGISGWIDGL